MACRCFVHNNQQTTVWGYLAAIKFFHKLYAGWELPPSHGMIVTVGKEIDRAHRISLKKVQVRLPLTWALLSQGKQVVASMVDEDHVMWLGLALSYFLLCRASALWADADGKVNPEFCLTRNCLTFSEARFRPRSRTERLRTLYRCGPWRRSPTKRGRGALSLGPD